MTEKPLIRQRPGVGWNRLLGVLWPFVSRRKHEQAIAAEKAKTQQIELRLRDCHLQHGTELEERTKRVDAIIQRLSELQWIGPDDGRYGLQISFDPRMMGYGNMAREELSIIAERFAWQVRREIETAKFVESARDNRIATRRGVPLY